MAGPPRAHFFIRGVGRVSPGVAHCGGVDAGKLPEAAFGAPETPLPEYRELTSVRERRHCRVAVDEVRAGHPNRCRAPRQGRFLGDDCRLSRFEPVFESPQDLIANVIHPRSHAFDGTPPAVPNLLV
ncbi:hypothetical protein MBOL_00780 [Mycobacteroides abscessus subsp. bolletii BD]|nr:hypothetical protein MBOL_00780 [Mycobacteroides abscessus subsp. bolletii BD]